MRARSVRAVMLGACVVMAAGCATSEEWATWRSHPAHFASNEHFVFSVRNQSATSPRVAQRDVTLAGSEGWWGRAVTVDQSAILQQ